MDQHNILGLHLFIWESGKFFQCRFHEKRKTKFSQPYSIKAFMLAIIIIEIKPQENYFILYMKCIIWIFYPKSDCRLCCGFQISYLLLFTVILTFICQNIATLTIVNWLHFPQMMIWKQAASLLGPCKGGSGDSGFKFQTDCGFEIQISKWQDSGFKF